MKRVVVAIVGGGENVVVEEDRILFVRWPADAGEIDHRCALQYLQTFQWGDGMQTSTYMVTER